MRRKERDRLRTNWGGSEKSFPLALLLLAPAWGKKWGLFLRRFRKWKMEVPKLPGRKKLRSLRIFPFASVERQFDFSYPFRRTCSIFPLKKKKKLLALFKTPQQAAFLGPCDDVFPLSPRAQLLSSSSSSPLPTVPFVIYLPWRARLGNCQKVPPNAITDMKT